MTPKPGIYPGVPFTEYQHWDAVNNSLLWRLKMRSPAHAIHERLHPAEPTPALVFGQALHALILEPATWEERFAIKPECDRRTKDGKATYEAFLEFKGDKQEVSQSDFDTIEAIANSVRAQQCRELICAGRSEVSIVWEDQGTGLLLKGRLDYERADGWNHFITDVKTTEDASEYGFALSIAKYGYYQAAAMYCDGWKAITGDDSMFVWLAVEKKPPYVTKVWECHEDLLAAGRNSYHEALRICALCMKENRWPAYGDWPSIITGPEWLLRREGVGPDMIRPVPTATPAYTVGPEPETQEDDFDKFMEQ